MTWVKLVENRVDSGLVLMGVGGQLVDMIRERIRTAIANNGDGDFNWYWLVPLN